MGDKATILSRGKKNAKFADADSDSVPSFQAILERVRAVISAKMSRFRSMVVVVVVDRWMDCYGWMVARTAAVTNAMQLGFQYLDDRYR
jgi:hypothetical protein